MDEDDECSKIEVENARVENITVEAPGKSSAAQTWTAITPLASLLIAALSLLSSGLLSVYQTRSKSLENQDAEWRAALEKTTLNEGNAKFVAYEMETFFPSAKLKKRARRITIEALSLTTDHTVFEDIFQELDADTDGTNSQDLVLLVHKISDRLHELHEVATKAATPAPELDPSFESFVLHPEWYLKDPSKSADLAQAQAAGWKLDTISAALRRKWLEHGRRATDDPDGDLYNGSVLINADFSAVDFRNVSLAGAEFIGGCPSSGKVAKDNHIIPVSARAESSNQGARTSCTIE